MVYLSPLYPRDLEAPHTLTTWLGEAFCLHPEAGLGVAAPDTLLVSQDFFAEISLPYSVKRGEVFPLNISVFNYVDQELPIRVELLVNDADIAAAKKSVDMCVLPKNNQVVTLMVSSLILGEVNITSKATIRNDIEGCQTVATGEGFSDTLVKPLRVKPEGVPVEIVQSEFKCMDPTDSEALQFPNNFELDNLELPDNVVEGSERAWVHVTGDVMAPALENVGSLVSLPTGCGEQNMVGLVPNIYLLDYLAAVGKDENMPEVVKKAKNYMNIGYKRQQNYRHPDGAYSIWGGKGDKDGSTWLTAFVVKAFSEASNFISVDSSLVQASVNWLLKGQMENGCFTKRGYVHSSYLKGGLSDDSLTAFVLTALHTASKNMKTVEVDQEKLSAAYSCMMASVNTSDLYTTIVAAHAANLWWGGEQVQEVARLMEAIESRADTSSGLKFWETEKEEVECESRCWWYYRPTSEAVEMTAYNVMSYVLRDQLPMALEPVKWLAKQRNSKGRLCLLSSLCYLSMSRRVCVDPGHGGGAAGAVPVQPAGHQDPPQHGGGHLRGRGQGGQCRAQRGHGAAAAHPAADAAAGTAGGERERRRVRHGAVRAAIQHAPRGGRPRLRGVRQPAERQLRGRVSVTSCLYILHWK